MIANINAGDVFNQTAFAAALHIGRSTLLRNQERILEELKDCYEFTYKVSKKGNLSMIQFTKKICDYEYEASNSVNKKEKDTLYQQFIPEVIQNQPLNTPTNISRIVYSKYPRMKELASARTIQNEVQQKTK